MLEMKNSLPTTTKLDKSILIKLNQEEQRIVIASYGSSRFRTYDNKAKQELAKSLIELSYFVGIKEPLSLDNLKLLVKFLCTQYPNFTKDELIEAVNISCSGKLGDIEHFQNFSPMYLGKIINGYLSYTANARMKYQALIQEQQRQIQREEEEKNYDVVGGALKVIYTEYDIFKKTNGYDPENEHSSPYHEIITQSCVMLLQRSLLFFGEEPLDNKISHTERMATYFKTLPKSKQDALAEMKRKVEELYVQKKEKESQLKP